MVLPEPRKPVISVIGIGAMMCIWVRFYGREDLRWRDTGGEGVK